MSAPDREVTISRAMTLAAPHTDHLRESPRSTIRPSLATEPGYASVVGAGASATGLQLGGVLGEGGMGVVRVGTQRALHREVAVKALRDPLSARGDQDPTLPLLREAWVTGSLEHPNIAPVYDIYRDDAGLPLVILKKLEGDDWRALMHDPETVRARYDAEDLLEWNLRILLQVCNAVRFAHSRGIVHRDIKPDNVRIGTFGEVYLLDWGIAVSLRDDQTGRFVLARDVREMAGTPTYMAPEMLGGEGSRIDERTDVYLLGAVLYEILCGTPPHQGDTVQALLGSIVLSEPHFDPRAPRDLVRIVRRAMQPRQEERYGTAEAFQADVQAYLRHQAASRLVERANELRTELELAFGPRVDRATWAGQGLFSEARFAFQHALEIWPTNPEARAGLHALCVSMAEQELALGEPEAARRVLAELTDAPTELLDRVRAAIAERSERDAKLHALQADLDPRGGQQIRGALGVLTGTTWVLTPLVMHMLHFHGGRPVSPFVGVVAGLILTLILLALFMRFRDAAMRTRLNRSLVAGSLLGLLAVVLTNATALTGEVSMWAPLSECLVVWGGLSGVIAATVEPRLAWSAAAYFAGYLALAAVGREFVLLVTSAANLVLTLNVAALWRSPGSTP
ncbi:MAG: protein kinase [Sandaracinaceae bacterium]|nr:protein kinase [Myxococcales bacterium]MCB9658428.1 protein kinase [Sandaracinaceae bacterium]